MSAYLCSPIHIAVLARAMTRPLPGPQGLTVADDAAEVAAALAGENWRSVAYRYPWRGEADLYPADPFIIQPYGSLAVYEDAAVYAAQHTPMRPLPHYRLYGVVTCYEYQSCEHPGWEQSTAAAYCKALRGLLLRTLAEAAARQHGAETGWHIEDGEVTA